MYWMVEFFQSTTGILTAVLIGLVSYLFIRSRFRKSIWQSKGVREYRQGFLSIFRSPVDVQLETLKIAGKTFGDQMVGITFLSCTEPDVIKDVLVRDFNMFFDRGFTIENETVFNDMVSVVSDIDKWKRIRAVMAPTFSTGKLRRMRTLVEECTKIMVKNVDKLKNKENEVEVKRLFGAFAMEVTTQVAFGTKVDSLIDEDNPLVVNANKLFDLKKSPIKIMRMFILFTFPKLADWLNIKFLDQDSIRFYKSLTMKLIEERRMNQDLKRKKCDFLQLMLDAMDDNKVEEEEAEEDKLQYYSHDGCEYHKITTHHKTLSDDEILAQAIMFFFAGYETTASTISFATYFLAMNKDCQEKLYEEVEATFEREKEITYDVVMSLKYLDAVVCETLRLYPPNPVIQRMANQDVTLSNGIKLPKGCAFLVPMIALHHDSDNFPDAECFQPERFFPENRCHHPFAYLPFGAGPRNCIGMRLALMDVKLALFHFVLNYQFSLSPKSPIPPKIENPAIIAPKEVILCVDKRKR